MSINITSAFVPLTDIINNFIVSYTGVGKLLPDTQRPDVAFHAKRCLLEFSYETLKSGFTVSQTAAPSITLPDDFLGIISVTVGGQKRVLTSQSSASAGEYLVDEASNTLQLSGNDTGGALEYKYLSNALTIDENACIPRLAEEAMYSCMVYSILRQRKDTPLNTLELMFQEKELNLKKSKSRLVYTNFTD